MPNAKEIQNRMPLQERCGERTVGELSHMIAGKPVELFAPATTVNSIKNPIVTGVLQPPHDDGIYFVGGGCNTPPTKEIHPLPFKK